MNWKLNQIWEWVLKSPELAVADGRTPPWRDPKRIQGRLCAALALPHTHNRRHSQRIKTRKEHTEQIEIMSKKGYFLSLLLCFFSMACSECLAQCRQWHSIAMHSLFLGNISRYLCCQWESSIGSKAPMKSLSSSTRDVVHIVTSMSWIPRACRRFYALCILRGSHRLICFQVKPLSLWIFGPSCKSTAVPASTALASSLAVFFLHST